jgi:hypothetical protein
MSRKIFATKSGEDDEGNDSGNEGGEWRGGGDSSKMAGVIRVQVGVHPNAECKRYQIAFPFIDKGVVKPTEM